MGYLYRFHIASRFVTAWCGVMYIIQSVVTVPITPCHRHAAVVRGALVLALSATGGARAAEMLVYSTNIAPFSYTDRRESLIPSHSERPGAVNELLLLAARHTGMGLDIRALPFKRLHAQLQTHPDTLAVMWRLPEVAASRVWLHKLLDDELVVIVRRNSPLLADRLPQVKLLRVGVVLGGPAEAVVRRMGFARVETAASAESNARKLAAGRIDAWVAFRSVAAVTQRQIGSSPDALRFGMTLGALDLYLTCGPRSRPEEVMRWRAAFAQLHQQGLQQSLLRHYHLSAGPATMR